MEIIVATLIFSLVMTGLVNLFITGKRYILHSRSRMTGAEVGRYFLDPLQMNVRQDTWGNATSNNLTPSTYLGVNQTLDAINYTSNYTISNVTNTTLRKAKVQINWTEPSPQ